ncbi:PREDICTED: E3 ubiquitin-protein ligase HUWE1-like [Priapulus caudatus]|uniref:E3 ubiquitin-protein ligase HUWE1-like n=1 Tax=Priapulus caudatus TaxID=37621 RepID=A0ABM1F3W7_PRICU|nr:PREDICTED: E3 ubiquitin-protein ligase HUWE1-like [Priapulus caudatus]
MEADEDEYTDMEESMIRYLDGDDDLYIHPDSVYPDVLFGGDVDAGIRSFQQHVGLDDGNANESGGIFMPAQPGGVSAAHPLLVHHADTHASSHGHQGATRLHRTGGRRQAYRIVSPTVHVHYARHPNPPAILQRFLGPSTAHDILQLTSVTTPGGATTRLLVPSDDVHILTHHDDAAAALYDGDGELFTGGAALGTVASALARWTEECRVLDGESMHDCVTGT